MGVLVLGLVAYIYFKSSSSSSSKQKLGRNNFTEKDRIVSATVMFGGVYDAPEPVTSELYNSNNSINKNNVMSSATTNLNKPSASVFDNDPVYGEVSI